MVLAFLQAEIDSPRFQASIPQVPGVNFRALVESADLRSDRENAIRRRILGAYRGFGTLLFESFPNDLDWHRARLTVDELGAARYANYPTWVTLSAGTRRIADGALNIGNVPLPDELDPTEHVLAIAAPLRRAGRSLT
jgi:hypothetical protein